MKTLITFIISATVLFSISGCSPLQKIADASISAYTISQDMESGKVQEIVYSVDHSVEDIERLRKAHDMYSKFMGKWEDKISNVYKSMPRNLSDELLRDYDALIIPAYMIVDSVVRRSWDDYTDIDKAYLMSYQRNATDTSTAVEDYRAFRANQSAIFSAIHFAEMVGAMIVSSK